MVSSFDRPRIKNRSSSDVWRFTFDLRTVKYDSSEGGALLVFCVFDMSCACSIYLFPFFSEPFCVECKFCVAFGHSILQSLFYPKFRMWGVRKKLGAPFQFHLSFPLSHCYFSLLFLPPPQPEVGTFTPGPGAKAFTCRLGTFCGKNKKYFDQSNVYSSRIILSCLLI